MAHPIAEPWAGSYRALDNWDVFAASHDASAEVSSPTYKAIRRGIEWLNKLADRGIVPALIRADACGGFSLEYTDKGGRKLLKFERNGSAARVDFDAAGNSHYTEISGPLP